MRLIGSPAVPYTVSSSVGRHRAARRGSSVVAVVLPALLPTLLGCASVRRADGTPGDGGGAAPFLGPAARDRVLRAAAAPSTDACDSLVEAIAADERLEPAVARLLARSLALHRGAVVRWPTGGTPILVWVQMPPLTTRSSDGDAERDALRREAFVRTARDAVADWNGAAAGVRLRLVADSADAAVVVTWVRRVPPRAEAPGVRPDGRSSLLRNVVAGTVEAATVVLGTVEPDGAPRAARDVHAVAIHEIGHVLGLAELPARAPRAEPRAVAPVMTADVAADEVTAADRAALRVWYALPAGPLCRAADHR